MTQAAKKIRRLLLLLAVFIIPTTALAATGWVEQTPAGFTDHLYGVHFVNETTGFAVGAAGKVLKTTDRGNTWTSSVVGDAAITWYDVTFPTPTTGYVAGARSTTPYIYKTTNGGVSWAAETLGVNKPDGYRSIHFSSTSTGAAGGMTNGASGTNISSYPAWSGAQAGNGTADIYGISFYSSTGYAVGNYVNAANPGIYKSVNGGAAWSNQTNPASNDIQAVQALSAGAAWAVGDSDTIIRTTDGSSWSTKNSGLGSGINLRGVHFYDADNGWAVGLGGKIYRTSNGSDPTPSWTAQTSGTSIDLEAVHAIDGNNAWAVGGGSAVILKYVVDPTVSSIIVDGRNDRPLNYSGAITIEGTNFQTAATVSATGMDISISSLTSTRITGVATLTASGTQTVTVYNPDTGSGSGTCTVNPLPTVTSVNPASMTQGDSGSVVITGTGFQSGITTSDIVFSLSGITVNSVTVNGANSLTVNITISGAAPTGTGDWTVTNPDSGSGTGSGIFSVTPTGVINPTITSVSPSSATQGATVAVTITGTNFLTGPTVLFGDGDITVNSVTFNSPTSLGANLTVSATAATTVRTVTVQNTDGGIGSKSNAFQVVSASAVSPTISSITNVPTFGAYVGTTGKIYITGTGFLAGANVTIDPATSITINNVEVISATALRVDLSIAASAATGTRDLTVTNTDGGFATSSGGLAIKALSNPAALGQPIPIFFSPNPWNYNLNPTVTAQFNWSGPAAVVKFVMIGGAGLPLKAPWNVNVSPGINNVLIDASTQLGHKLPVGIHPLLGINSNKVVVKGLLVVSP